MNFRDPWVGTDTPGPREAVFPIRCDGKPTFIIPLTYLKKNNELFPNSCADRGSHGLNSIQACWFPLGCRLEKGFREGSACQKSILAAGLPLKVHHFYNFSHKT